LSLPNNWNDFPFVSTLQVWVEQYDPEGSNSFYSPAPVQLGLFPVQADGDPTSPPAEFSRWEFWKANQNEVTAEGCRYGKLFDQSTDVKILGSHIPEPYKIRTIIDTKKQTASGFGCFDFLIPTVALTHPEVVIQGRNVPKGIITFTAPLSLVTALYRPEFEKPQLKPTWTLQPPLRLTGWEVKILVSRVDCHDQFDVTDPLAKKIKWLIYNQELTGPVPSDSCAVRTASRQYTDDDWQTASRNENIMLEVQIDKSDVADLPEGDVNLMRDGMRIARLPSLRNLLLPTTLTAALVGKTQVSLEGKNAGVIDAVSIQGPDGPYDPQKVVGSGDVVLASIPVANQAKPANTPAVGTYTVLPLVCKNNPCGDKPEYIPIEATDPKGNPLTFVIPEPAKAAATPASDGGQTTTIGITKNVKVTGTPTTPPAKKPGG
jgi:hypothetical protein